ncbi:MAG: peptidoglycan DD-metalloendopeptidase family protein [Candidatus Latescibacteria bacterium]|nr:peptidoglycan DD-metalloendopeptidase family protein [Candidatus Latescibacterota bacterium]
MYKKFLWVLAVILFGLNALKISAQENIDASRQELEKIQQQLKNVQTKINNLEKEETGVLKRIDAYDEKIGLTKKLIRELESARKSKESEITKVSQQIRETEKNINNRQSDLENLLVSYYKTNRILPLELLISEQSFARLYQKTVYMRIIAQDRKSRINEFRSLKSSLELQRRQLTSAKQELQRLRTEREKEQKNLADLQNLEKKVLNRVKNEKSQNISLEQELKTAAVKLEKLIAELEAKRRERKLAPGTHYLEIMKGKLPWPYYGTVVSKFGSQEDPKYKTKIKNTGIHIKTPANASIKAIANGRVVYADRFMGYGNMLILDHSDGYYSLYSNLSEFTSSVGMNVQQGEIVGRAKDMLHFELRCEGKSVDPLLWLSR